MSVRSFAKVHLFCSMYYVAATHLLQKRYSSDAIDVHNENDKVINSIAMFMIDFYNLWFIVVSVVQDNLDLIPS